LLRLSPFGWYLRGVSFFHLAEASRSARPARRSPSLHPLPAFSRAIFPTFRMRIAWRDVIPCANQLPSSPSDQTSDLGVRVFPAHLRRLGTTKTGPCARLVACSPGYRVSPVLEHHPRATFSPASDP
jgi:hypothetical protein